MNSNILAYNTCYYNNVTERPDFNLTPYFKQKLMINNIYNCVIPCNITQPVLHIKVGLNERNYYIKPIFKCLTLTFLSTHLRFYYRIKQWHFLSPMMETCCSASLPKLISLSKLSFNCFECYFFNLLYFLSSDLRFYLTEIKLL